MSAPVDGAPRSARVGECFERSVTLDPAGVSAFARSVGDSNPLHHDAAHAAASPFGTTIACGPQLSSLLMAVTADVFAARGLALGLDFRMQFRRAAPSSAALLLHWTVTEVRWQPSLGGEVVRLSGRITDAANGTQYVSAEGLVLVKQRW